MATRKDGMNQNPEEGSRTVSSDYERVNDKNDLATREISHDLKDDDESCDNEELNNEELTEADFAVDEDEGEEDEDF